MAMLNYQRVFVELKAWSKQITPFLEAVQASGRGSVEDGIKGKHHRAPCAVHSHVPSCNETWQWKVSTILIIVDI